ncbi:unnamed protein product [Urochloa humidicola]
MPHSSLPSAAASSFPGAVSSSGVLLLPRCHLLLPRRHRLLLPLPLRCSPPVSSPPTMERSAAPQLCPTPSRATRRNATPPAARCRRRRGSTLFGEEDDAGAARRHGGLSMLTQRKERSWGCLGAWRTSKTGKRGTVGDRPVGCLPPVARKIATPLGSFHLFMQILVALSVIFTVVAGDCPGAGTNMTVEAACREACGTAAPARGIYQLCLDTLRDEDAAAGSADDAGEYAYRATWRALWAYLDTMGLAWHFLGEDAAAPALAGGEEEKAVYAFCVGGRYPEAETAMDRVLNRLPEHCSADIAGEYKRALRDVAACRDRVARLPSSALLAMVEADYDRTLLAYLLGKLIGVK